VPLNGAEIKTKTKISNEDKM